MLALSLLFTLLEWFHLFFVCCVGYVACRRLHRHRAVLQVYCIASCCHCGRLTDKYSLVKFPTSQTVPELLIGVSTFMAALLVCLCGVGCVYIWIWRGGGGGCTSSISFTKSWLVNRFPWWKLNCFPWITLRPWHWMDRPSHCSVRLYELNDCPTLIGCCVSIRLLIGWQLSRACAPFLPA